LSQSNPILGYLGVLKLSKQKSFENVQIFFLYSVQMRQAIGGGNFTPIGEYLSTAKTWQK
jgi:hypothetical protein